MPAVATRPAQESAAPPAEVVATPAAEAAPPQPVAPPAQLGTATPGHARIRRVVTSLDGVVSTRLQMTPGQGTLRVTIEFDSDPEIPMPTAGMTFELANTMILSSVVSRTDKVMLERDAQGRGTATIEFGPLALRKGDYYIGAYLGNENAIHLYSEAPRIALLSVADTRPEPGLVDLPHQWRIEAGHADD